MTTNSERPARQTDDNPLRSFSLPTPVGTIAVTSDATAVIRVEWTEPHVAEAAPSATWANTGTVLSQAVEQLRQYFNDTRTDFDIPIDFGPISDVAKVVLTTLASTVEHGDTITYGELANRSGTGIPARAVGGIMGLNPLPIIVPCHRVVASDGLGGYSGGLPGHGLETKRWLLEFEDALPQTLF